MEMDKQASLYIILQIKVTDKMKEIHENLQ